MICCALALDSAGLLRSCEVSGHAGTAAKGFDIVCAAVSVLARTSAAVLDRLAKADPALRVKAEAPERGKFTLIVGQNPAFKAETRAYLLAAADFLQEGLLSVAREYPEHCTVKITKG
jgi:uncharacterized protein YsxB (DUF464 family)